MGRGIAASALLLALFTRVRGETVWKIAKGVSAVLLAAKEMADRDSFDPSWPLSEPRFGTHPDFPNSFSTSHLINTYWKSNSNV